MLCTEFNTETLRYGSSNLGANLDPGNPHQPKIFRDAAESVSTASLPVLSDLADGYLCQDSIRSGNIAGSAIDCISLAMPFIGAGIIRKILKHIPGINYADEVADAARGGFRPGELFEATFETSAGRLDLLAEVEVAGSRLHLKDIAVYPRGADQLDGIGIGELKALADDLAEQARAAGFAELRITGTRVGGSMDGHVVDLVVDLGGG